MLAVVQTHCSQVVSERLSPQFRLTAHLDVVEHDLELPVPPLDGPVASVHTSVKLLQKERSARARALERLNGTHLQIKVPCPSGKTTTPVGRVEDVLKELLCAGDGRSCQLMKSVERTGSTHESATVSLGIS
jgi:hypothetical protein